MSYVSNPYRYSTNFPIYPHIDGPEGRFQTLIGILQTELPEKWILNHLVFQTLIGILQTLTHSQMAQYSETVSNPYRYSTNRTTKRHLKFGTTVSNPYRYSTNPRTFLSFISIYAPFSYIFSVYQFSCILVVGSTD